MINIFATIISGSGTVPKSIGKDSFLALTLEADFGRKYDWDVLSIPEGSDVVFLSQNRQTTKFGPLDTYGVYQVKGWVDLGLPTEQSTTLSLAVPPTVGPFPAPPEPLYDLGGRVRNFSFELPGSLPGVAFDWDVQDDANLLSSGAGVTRGRIIPSNFDVHSGEYVMCLGDDLNGSATMADGDIFSVSQDIDFTGMNTLILTLKLNNP